MDSHTNNDSCWRNITAEFKECVKELNLGELLKTEHFTLLEAMSCIELMDPKMDSEMVYQRANRKVLNLEQSIRADLVKIKDLAPNELIGIIDESYSRFATWLDGHALALTVMTNLYLHEPERIEDKCLRVFSLASLKLVEYLHKLVQMVLCVEEEDFLLADHKLPHVEVNEQKLLSNIEDLCRHYQRLMSECDSNQVCEANNQESVKLPFDSPETDHQQVEENNHELTKYNKSELSAMYDRLKFTHHFYAFFLGITRNLLKDNWDLNVQNEIQLQKTVKLVHNAVINCDQHLEMCLTYLDNWSKTIDLGIKPDASAVKKDNCGDYPTIMGFEPLINYRTLPISYPRVLTIKSRPATVEHLRNLVLKLRKCVSLSSVFNQRSFGKSLEAIEQFSKYYKPGSCVISRSFMMALYLPLRSNKLLKDELLQSMLEYCEPVITSLRKNEAICNDLEKFLTVSAQSFHQFISMYGHNAARQHEKLTSDLILEFKNLQYSCFLFNELSKHNIIQSWVTYHFARFCVQYVLSGLELELYSTHEYPYVFWYLYDVLYRSERDQLELARQLIHESQKRLSDDNKKSSKVASKKQRKKNQNLTSFHDRNLRCNDAYRFLTGGLFLLTYGLKQQGKIRTPLMEFTSEEVCFDHRFGTMTGASVFQSYKQTIMRLEKLEHIYREALEFFLEARNLFENIGQHETCLKVCKTNIIVARILATNMHSFADRQVEFLYDVHPSFPIVKF